MPDPPESSRAGRMSATGGDDTPVRVPDGGRAREVPPVATWDEAPLPVLVVETGGRIRYANEAARRFLDVPRDAPLADAQFLTFVRADWRSVVADALQRVVADGEATELERVSLLDAADVPHFAYLAGTPTRFRGTDCALFLCKDDTDLVEARRDLVDRERKFRSIAESSYDLIFRIDEEGWLTYLSPAVERVLGYEPRDLVGQHLDSVVADESIEDAYEAYDQIESGEGIEDLELRVERRDGTERILSVNGRPIEIEGGGTGTQGVARDVTEQRARQRRLERQNERLERFASVVSHDLRNPMSAAHGALGLIRQEHEGKGVDILSQALQRMEELLDDLLALAREGQAVESTDPVGLERVATEAWTTSDTAGGELAVEADVIVQADEGRLRQLLENLFRNALDHGRPDAADTSGLGAGDTADGRAGGGGTDRSGDDDGLTITVGRLDGGFFVADDGVGIEPDQRDRIFEEGYSTSTDGTGFGLSIVREIAEAHGWSVAVSASEDGGAQFEITGVELEETAR